MKTRPAVGVAIFKGETMQAGDILTKTEAAFIEALIDTLENLIFYVEQAGPDLPDTARIEGLAFALDQAREVLKGYE